MYVLISRGDYLYTLPSNVQQLSINTTVPMLSPGSYRIYTISLDHIDVVLNCESGLLPCWCLGVIRISVDMPYIVYTRAIQTGSGGLSLASSCTMRANISVFSAASCFLSSVSSILYLVSFASPYWFESKDGHSYVRSGIWSTCQTVVGGDNKMELSCGNTENYLDTSK